MAVRNSLSLLSAAACLGVALPGPAPAQQAPPEPAREFRGAWVATVDNIDWPSRPGLPADQQRSELDAILDRAQALGLNALVFQVRPHCDAMYRSELEPWSEWLTGTQGKAPGPAWDPLEHAVRGAHARGMELHAWFNPFRARHAKSRSDLARNHPARREPSLAVAYGDYLWLDPGNPRAVDWSLRVIADVVARYDIDAVHVDDYFYPYPIGKQDFPDEDSYQRYRSKGGRLGKADWRRSNIDGFVQRMRQETQREKPWVRIGISPFGIARPGVPAGIQAGIDQYDQLYADTLKWLAEGWCDYFAPQLYWPIDQKPQSFAVLLPWWTTVNPRGRHLWPGLSAGRAAQAPKPWRKDELQTQIELIRDQQGADGFVLFSFKVLMREGGVPAILQRLHQEPALPPASPWLGGKTPAAPAAELRQVDGRRLLTWPAAADQRFAVVQVQRGGQGEWRTEAIVNADAGNVRVAGDDVRAVALRLVDRTGLCGPAAVVTR